MDSLCQDSITLLSVYTPLLPSGKIGRDVAETGAPG